MSLLRHAYFSAEDFGFQIARTCPDDHIIQFTFENIKTKMDEWTQPLKDQKKYLTGVIVTWTSYVPDQNGDDYHFHIHETFFPCNEDCSSFNPEPRLPIVPEYSYNISVSFETPVSDI